MTTITITLPESLRDFVERQAQATAGGDSNEYLRRLLEEALAREEEADAVLEQLLIEGLDSGGDILVTPEHAAQRNEAILARARTAARRCTH